MLQGEDLDPDALAAWQTRFDGLRETAERGAGWEGLVARARELAPLLDRRVGELTVQREQIGRALKLQAQGARALRSYKPG